MSFSHSTEFVDPLTVKPARAWPDFDVLLDFDQKFPTISEQGRA